MRCRKQISAIDGNKSDWANVPVVWRETKDEWGTPNDVKRRSGGQLGLVRYAINNAGTKLYYMLELKPGETFASDGQYGLTISSEEEFQEEYPDTTKRIMVMLQDETNFYAARSDLVDEGGKLGQGDNREFNKISNEVKSNKTSSFLEVELDIAKLNTILSEYDLGVGKYQVRGTSSLPADSPNNGYRYISRAPILKLDLNGQ